MSLEILTQVWAHSQQKGSNLLVMLALADYADNEGFCYPSIAKLATKARTTERHARRILLQLKEEGELQIFPGKGRNGSNMFRVLKNGTGIEPMMKPRKGRLTLRQGGLTKCQGVTNCQSDTQDLPPLTPTSAKPSVEPSVYILSRHPEPVQPIKREPAPPVSHPLPAPESEPLPVGDAVDLFNLVVPGFSLPGPLATPRHEEAWKAFMEVRAKKKAPKTKRVLDRIVRDLLEWGPDYALAALWRSAKSGWTNVFPQKDGKEVQGRPVPGKAGKVQVTHANVM